MRLEISICTFQGGAFDVMFRDKATGKEITFSGDRKVGDDELAFFNSIAPACVWTEYRRYTPPDGDK